MLYYGPIMAFAIIKTGGKQYKVTPGQTLKIEKLAAAEKGGKISFDEVLLVENGGTVKIGTPTVAGAKVSAEVTGAGLGKKVSVIHYKAKVRHQKIGGHRQPFTEIKIEKIA
jgi:large subunit ribosomal protein L21